MEKYLGAHMNAAANRFYGTTLTKRMQERTNDIERLNKSKAPYGVKVEIIRCAKLPKALYGCEVAPANEVGLRALRTSNNNALAYTADQRSADLTFAVASYGPDLDPDTHIFSRRAVAFRRYVTRHPKNAQKMRDFRGIQEKKGAGGSQGR